MRRPEAIFRVRFHRAWAFLPSWLLLVCFLSPSVRAAQGAKPDQRVASLTFEGNSSVDEATLRRVFRHVRVGSAYSSESLRFDSGRLEEHYRDQGYLRVSIGEFSVEQRPEADGSIGVVIRVPISEGPRYVLKSLEVRNAESLSPESLLQMAPLRTGQPYSWRRLEEWREKIVESYMSMGYIRFRGELTQEIDDDRHNVAAVLDCVEGGVYRVRRISIIGDESVDATEFRKKILVGEGGVYNPEMLTLTLQLLNELGIYKPMTGSDVELKIDDTTRAVDVVFRVSSRRAPSLLR